jgi:hypothetical protein
MAILDTATETRTAGPAATGTRRLAAPRREAQDELGCGVLLFGPCGADQAIENNREY